MIALGVMKKLLLAVILPIVLLTSGCGTMQEVRQLKKINQQLVVKQRDLQNREAAYVQGVTTALRHIPADKQVPEDKLALRLANDAQGLLGVPTGSLVIDTDKLLAHDLNETKILEHNEKQGAQVLEDKNKLEEKKQGIEDKLIDTAIKLDAERHASLWFKIKMIGFGLLGIVGLGVLCYFFPIVIPIGLTILSRIKSIFTKK